MQVLVADVAPDGDGQRDGGHARALPAPAARTGALDTSVVVTRASEDEHVRALADESLEHGGIGGAPGPGEGAQGKRVHGEGGRGVAVAGPRLQLPEEAHEGGAVAAERGRRVREGGHCRRLGLEPLDQRARALLHGGQARARARRPPSAASAWPGRGGGRRRRPG